MLKRLPYLARCACAALEPAPRLSAEQLQRLADSPEWIALGHYETGKLGGWRSYVDDETFFLAADGEQDPGAELAATLAALYGPASAGDRHAQCRYPARPPRPRRPLQLGGPPPPPPGG